MSNILPLLTYKAQTDATRARMEWLEETLLALMLGGVGIDEIWIQEWPRSSRTVVIARLVSVAAFEANVQLRWPDCGCGTQSGPHSCECR